MTAYPRISPAMMVLIRKGDSVLLALHREVFEEVGLLVHNLNYFIFYILTAIENFRVFYHVQRTVFGKRLAPPAQQPG